jgi:carboxyl-terminal processing protease
VSSYYYTPSGRSIQRPFKDKDAYQRLVGRLQLEDGQKMEDALEKLEEVADSTGKDLDSLIYYTKKGRKVFAGGGITPDYIVKETRLLKDFTVELRKKRLFTIFADMYLNNEGSAVKDKYQDNFIDFYRNYELDDDAWDAFKELADDNEIEWNDDEFEEDMDFIVTRIKTDMANIIWTRHESRQMSTKIDKQLNEALKLFPEAEEIFSM